MAQLPAMDLFGRCSSFQRATAALQIQPIRTSTLARIEDLFGGHLPSPAELLKVDPARLREAGLSWRKIGTLRDLAGRFGDRRLDHDALGAAARRRAAGFAHGDSGDWTLDSTGRAHNRAAAGRCRAAWRSRTPQGGADRIPARPPPRRGGSPGHRRQVAALPQPRDQLPVLRRVRGGRAGARYCGGALRLAHRGSRTASRPRYSASHGPVTLPGRA